MLRRASRGPFFGILLVFGALATAGAQTEQPPVAVAANVAAVQSRLDKEIDSLAGHGVSQAPALQVAIAQNGRIVYDRGFGDASTDTRFPIASVTKMFTAVAVMQLVQSHRVDLDAKIVSYLPNAPYAKEITVRELLQHTSGLWNYGDDAFQTGLVAKPTTPAAILAMAAAHPLTSPPGTKWSYSNTGYVVLGLIVEHVSGEPLARYELENIYRRAGMTQTTMGTPAAGIPVAAGYMSASGERAPAYDPSWLYACGDIVSTAADVARFDVALQDGRLLAPSTLAQMQAEPVLGDHGMQGLGVDMIHVKSLHLMGHHGGVPGYETENEIIPTQHVAWVVLSDAFDFGTYRANRIVLSSLFPQLFPQLVSLPAVATEPEDPAVTQRFSEALSSILRGNIDRSEYTESVNAALTPELLAQTAAQLKSLGGIIKIVYLGAAQTSSGKIYSYNVTFSSGQTMTWQFVLDPHGKIAEIGSNG